MMGTPAKGARRVERRLSAILAADVVGYSRLMDADEEGTLARLKAHHRGVVEPAIARAGGRIVKLMGDGVLCEFASVVDAVACAVAIQGGMAGRERDLPEDRRIRYRIGVNLGDIIVEDRDIFGDGVNVAARMEALAEPGGVCVSGKVHEEVRDKLPYPFEDAGEQTVKNIARPVRVHALRAAAIEALPPPAAPDGTPTGRRRRAGITVAAAVAAGLLSVAGAGAWWLMAGDPASPAATTVGPPATGGPAPRLSVVVLPFANLSGDPAQEYVADAITEDLTTDLSRVAGSFVIGRGTAFTYKGKPADARQVGRELGVRYVLEGSVRGVEDRFRVNARLVDAETGADLWSDRLEGDRTRLAALQDEVTGRLAATLNLELLAAENRRSQRERPNDPDAIDLVMRGMAAMNRPRSRGTLEEARGLFAQALLQEPASVEALVGHARTGALLVLNRWSGAPDEYLREAEDAVRRALAAEPDHALAHFVRGDINRARKRFDAAIADYEAAVALDRNLASAHAQLGQVKILVGRSPETFAHVEQAMRLSPRDPAMGVWLFFACHANSHLARDEATVETCNRAVMVNPFWIAYTDLAAAHAWQGRTAEAGAALAELERLMPGYTAQKFATADWSDHPVFLAEYARILEGLRKAGLRES